MRVTRYGDSGHDMHRSQNWRGVIISRYRKHSAVCVVSL